MWRIRQLFISSGHNFVGHHGGPPGECPAVECAQIECVAGRGIRGDRFFDHRPDYKGQITFFALEVFEDLCRTLGLPHARPAAIRRNVLTEGLDLKALIGAEFELQGTRFAGVEECRPCYWMNSALGPGAEEWLRGRGGLRARILSNGRLRVGAAEWRRLPARGHRHPASLPLVSAARSECDPLPPPPLHDLPVVVAGLPLIP